jgi:hypothetical protein
MDEQRLPVPVFMTLELVAHHGDDRLEHELRVGVVGVNQPLVVKIESQFYGWPHVKEYQSYGGIDLPERLQDAFVFKCFELLATQLDGTDHAHLWVPDATRWIEVQFLDAEARVLLDVLRRQVTPGLVVDERQAPPGMIPWRR